MAKKDGLKAVLQEPGRVSVPLGEVGFPYVGQSGHGVNPTSTRAGLSRLWPGYPDDGHPGEGQVWGQPDQTGQVIGWVGVHLGQVLLDRVCVNLLLNQVFVQLQAGHPDDGLSGQGRRVGGQLHAFKLQLRSTVLGEVANLRSV